MTGDDRMYAAARAALADPAAHAINPDRLLDDAVDLDRLAHIDRLPPPVLSIHHPQWSTITTIAATGRGMPAPVAAWIYAAEAHTGTPTGADVAARLRAVARAVIEQAPLRAPRHGGA
ncbi:MAG: hypothetical protein OEV62_00075 [Actinomycetota bacterium]|nr:hypothetical protein [Actinomycetota bacterium]